MQTSETTDKLYAAIAAFQRGMGTVKHTSKNPHFKNTYTDLPSLMDAIKGPLEESGLMLVMAPAQSEPDRVHIGARVVHVASCQWMEGTLTLGLPKISPQETGSAITYGRRYIIGLLLGVVTDKDDDGQAASQPRRPAKPVSHNGGNATSSDSLI